MDEERTLDLTNLYGFARLYKTLVQDGGGKRSTSDMLYGCYLANISLCNKGGMALQPVEPEIFFYKMQSNSARPYKTEIQTIKALTLLEWNMEIGGTNAEAVSQLCHVKTDYVQRFYDETGPKLVYICAPLRGDVEKNIAFAKEKAREVFLEGNIPVCPHLLFPPIADPRNPVEDKAAMRMCLKLIERCSEMRVYGPVWSEGMWDEIQYAEKLKIPILTDQKEVPRTRCRNELCR